MQSRDCFESVGDRLNSFTSVNNIQASPEDHKESPPAVNYFETPNIQISFNVMNLESSFTLNIPQISVTPLYFGQPGSSSSDVVQNSIHESLDSVNMESLQNGEERDQEKKYQVSSDSSTLLMKSQAPWPLLQENTSFNSFGKTPDEQLELGRSQSQTIQKQESSSTSKIDESNQSAFFGATVHGALKEHHKKYIPQTEPKLNEVQEVFDFRHSSFNIPSYVGNEKIPSGNGVWQLPTLQEEMQSTPSINVIIPLKSSQSSSGNGIYQNSNELHFKNHESTYTSKTPTFPFDHQILERIESLKQKVAKLDSKVSLSNDDLTQRLMMALSQVVGFQIDDQQSSFDEFLRSFKIKLTSTIFIDSVKETNFLKLNQLMEAEPELKSKLEKINPEVLLYLQVALQVQNIYKLRSQKNQKNSQELTSLGSDGSMQFPESIKINPIIMDLNFFSLPPLCDLHPEDTQFEEQKQFFNENLTPTMINIERSFLMGSDLEMPNSFVLPLQSKQASSIKHNNSTMQEHVDEVADQLKKLEEEEQFKISTSKLYFNRKMDVEMLDLRGLSSDDESASQSADMKQQHFRKPFNKFKEDKSDTINESTDEHDYQRIGMRASHNLSPQFLNQNRETVKRKKQSKNRRDPSDWPKHGEVINEGIRRPQLNTNKSMTNAMSSFKSHEAMTDMQQRYMAFNSYIQAQNRIESLVSENSHLQKLLFSSQHDLRLLQRFTKSYFKSMEFFKQKDILTDDAATHKVLMSCFQDKPVVLLAFSSPLVRKVENMVTQKVTLTEMPLLDFTKEFAGAVNGIQETRNAIKIAYVQATVEKLFQFCIDENPVGIHFSGHGVSNEISMNGVSCLVMETEDGCAHYLSEDQLTKFIKDLNNPLKFVFLSSCHSEFAGYLFHLAGVDHVICVKQNEEIYDKAAIILAKHFYNFLFSERNTVCKAFERAKMFLSSNADPKLSAEANKFIMIKDSDDISDRIQERLLAHNDISLGKRRNFATKAKKHECKVLGPFLPGQIEVINKKPPFPFEIKMNPSDQIIGRQLDIQSIVDSIKQKNRVVIVQGMVGIGKSVVIKKVGQFFHDRESFRDGVIYFSMRDRNWVNQLISKMHNFISTNKTEDDYDDIDLSKDQSLTSSSEAEGGKSQFNVSELREGEATEIPQIAQEFKQIVDRQKVHEIWTCLSKRECLVIVDNTENLLRDDEQQFNKLFEILLEKCPEIQLLISANEHFKHKIPETFFYYLPPISNQHSLELLQLKSGHCITQQEIRELLQKTSMSKRNENGPKVSKLQDHHLCTILGGHQGAITLLAPLFKNRSLFEFYKTLLKMFEDPSLLQDIGEIGSYHTLKISLTAMTKHLQKTNPLAIQLFSLVSLMPGGVFEKDLTVIWGSVKWIVLAEGLMQSSLMSVKVEKMSGEHHGKRKYSLLQFINKFAESLLSQSKLQEFHERICENLCIKIQHYSNNCSVEHAKHKQQQYQMEILDIEINIWACIYRILDFNTPKEEHHKLKTKLKQNYLHHQAGDSSAEENNHKVIVHGTVDFSEISDTCDERLIKDFDREELSTITKNVENTNKSISPSETDRNKGSSNGLSKLSEIKHSSNDQNKEKKPYVGLAVRMKKSHAQQQKFKKIINQPQIESRGRIQSLSIQFREQLKQNFRIEKRVSHQLAQIEKTQLKLMKEYPQEQQLNNEDKVQNKLILSDESACQKFFYEIQEQSDNGSLIEEKQVSQVDSVVAQNQFEQCQFSRENSTQRQHPKRQETNNSMQIWTRGSAASQQFLNISPRAHSVGDVSESFSIQQTYFTQKNPQDNIDCSYPQTENTQMNNTENFGDELQMQNLTYLKESEHDLTPRQMHSHEKQDELPLSVTSDISVIFQRDQRFSQPDHDMQSSAVEEDINPFSSASQNRPVEEGNPTMGFMPRSVGLQISINQERTDDQKRTPRTLTTSLHTTPLTTIEESYYKEMTSEQKLIVTYISLLVLSKRIPFALRAISLVDQHLKLKLICHANLTKLYGLCILKSKSEWIKDAFELFRRAKQIFKMVGGENNNQNIGVAQCYMIQGLLLKTKSEQIFAPMQLSQAVVDKRAIKRFEAAKQIYKERKHLAGQLFCCSELINIKKSMKAKYMHLVNEQKELESKLNGMYSEDSKLVYGTGSNSFFFIKRLDEMEFSLLVEMADYHQIVRIDVLTKKQLNPRTHLNKLVDKQSEQKPKEQWMSSTTINRKQPPKQKRAKIEFRQVQVPDHIVSPGSEMEFEKKIATQIEGETEDNEESKSIKPRRKPENKVLTKRTTTIIDSKKAQEKFLTQKNRQEITNMEETGAQEGEKPIRRKKYAHIQPKVNTHRKPFDHGISIDLNEQSSEWATESLK